MFLTLSLNTYHFPICFWNYGIQLLLLLGYLCVRSRNLWLFRFSQDFMRPISCFCAPGSILWVLEQTPPEESMARAKSQPLRAQFHHHHWQCLRERSGQLLKDAIYSLVLSTNYWLMLFWRSFHKECRNGVWHSQACQRTTTDMHVEPNCVQIICTC